MQISEIFLSKLYFFTYLPQNFIKLWHVSKKKNRIARKYVIKIGIKGRETLPAIITLFTLMQAFNMNDMKFLEQ